MEKQLNIQRLIVNVDSSDVVSLISSPSSTNRLTHPLVAECRGILQAFHQVRIGHCFRMANLAADSLARMGSLQQEAFVYYIAPPMFMLDVLFFDSASSSTPSVTAETETLVMLELSTLVALFFFNIPILQEAPTRLGGCYTGVRRRVRPSTPLPACRCCV